MADLADAVVVGGGLLGLSIAFELARRANRVVLIDEKRLAAGLTGSGFGWVNATSEEVDEKYHRLRAAAVAQYDALSIHGSGLSGIRDGGALAWADSTDLDAIDRLTRRAAALQALDYPVTLLNRDEMRSLEPRVQFPENALGLFTPADRFVEPMRLIRTLVEQARKYELEIRENCPVTGFSAHGGAIASVETPNGRISTRLVIVAAGPASAALVGKAAGPDGAAMVRTKAEPGLLVDLPVNDLSIGRVLFPNDGRGLHLRPYGGSILAGSDDGDERVAGGGIGGASAAAYEIVRRIGLHLPAAAFDVAKMDARVCTRVVPADGRPIVGAIPQLRGLYVSVTHSGVTLGPLLATLLAQEIATGAAPERLIGYAPRLIPN